jgi:hypothetical protein
MLVFIYVFVVYLTMLSVASIELRLTVWFVNSIYWILGAKRLGCEADHLPPTSAEVKKTWVYTSTPHKSSWCSA